MCWWSDWLIPLLITSMGLLIFKGGFILIILLWFFYLLIGYRSISKSKPEEVDEWVGRLFIGIAVSVIAIILNFGICK